MLAVLNAPERGGLFDRYAPARNRTSATLPDRRCGCHSRVAGKSEGIVAMKDDQSS